MKRGVLTLLCCSLCLSAQGQEGARYRQNSSRGQAAGYATRSATVLSMMGWGFLLAGGIAAICIAVPNDESTAHSH